MKMQTGNRHEWIRVSSKFWKTDPDAALGPAEAKAKAVLSSGDKLRGGCSLASLCLTFCGTG